MSYRLTPRAAEDIDLIASYVDESNPYAASNLIRSFMRRFELVAKHPYSGVARDDILSGIRHLVLNSYLAFYRVDSTEVVILRVLHGRREIVAQEIS